MKLWIRIILSLILLYAAYTGESCAQPKAISSIWSFNGIGIGYEHTMDEKSFIQTEIRSELTEVFINRKGRVGATASFTWNIVFAQHESANGNTIRFYAGPGAIAGMAPDRKASSGGIFGIKGRIGAECTFDRHVSLAVGFAPVVGMHTSIMNDVVNMRMYRNGMIYGLLPEVCIKYAF